MGIEPPIKIESLSPNNICFLFGSYSISHFSPFVNPSPPKKSIFTLKNARQYGIIKASKGGEDIWSIYKPFIVSTKTDRKDVEIERRNI